MLLEKLASEQRTTRNEKEKEGGMAKSSSTSQATVPTHQISKGTKDSRMINTLHRNSKYKLDEIMEEPSIRTRTSLQKKVNKIDHQQAKSRTTTTTQHDPTYPKIITKNSRSSFRPEEYTFQHQQRQRHGEGTTQNNEKPRTRGITSGN